MDAGQPEKDREGRRQLYRALKQGSVGIEMGLSVAIGWLFGAWLDRRFETAPTLTLTFVLLGVAAAFRALYRIARQAARDTKEDSGREDSGGDDSGQGGAGP